MLVAVEAVRERWADILADPPNLIHIGTTYLDRTAATDRDRLEAVTLKYNVFGHGYHSAGRNAAHGLFSTWNPDLLERAERLMLDPEFQSPLLLRAPYGAEFPPEQQARYEDHLDALFERRFNQETDGRTRRELIRAWIRRGGDANADRVLRIAQQQLTAKEQGTIVSELDQEYRRGRWSGPQVKPIISLWANSSDAWLGPAIKKLMAEIELQRR